MLGEDLLFAVMPQWDLNSCRRDLELEELVNYDFSSILDDCKKTVKDKATKEAKVVEELKKQLQKKLAIIKEKNKGLMDYQKKANEGEKRLLKLQPEVSKILKLEAKVKEVEEMVSSRDDMVVVRDKTLLVY
ncbi:hypothetical protein COCNU_04G009150 [Cocos nucifera]|uniref:Uncharacterized protein n=1 Tax=Cocos nucifera TaxID=13894 RepID=A0A8K0I746_COCNU|nr:hypothetical protein COCNU_04G009150 [Cocos nucifera]